MKNCTQPERRTKLFDLSAKLQTAVKLGLVGHNEKRHSRKSRGVANYSGVKWSGVQPVGAGKAGGTVEKENLFKCQARCTLQ